MPLYLYRCVPCDKAVEVLRGRRSLVEPCPHCKQPMVPQIAPATVPPSGTYSYNGG